MCFCNNRPFIYESRKILSLFFIYLPWWCPLLAVIQVYVCTLLYLHNNALITSYMYVTQINSHKLIYFIKDSFCKLFFSILIHSFIIHVFYVRGDENFYICTMEWMDVEVCVCLSRISRICRYLVNGKNKIHNFFLPFLRCAI